jgi:DDE superfamily endonuclease
MLLLFHIVGTATTWLNRAEPMLGKTAIYCLPALHSIFFFRPANREELFNLRHASARNVIERIFGVMKAKWDILTRAPEYDMDIQARIPPALAAIHNFILKHDDVEWEAILAAGANDPNPGTRNNDPDMDFGTLAAGPATDAEKTRSEARRDAIAQAMWESYLQILRERGEEFAYE